MLSDMDDDDIADDGSLEVEWYPVPEWLESEFEGDREALGQAKVYLKPGERPPKGAVVQKGKKGGSYYESTSHVVTAKTKPIQKGYSSRGTTETRRGTGESSDLEKYHELVKSPSPPSKGQGDSRQVAEFQKAFYKRASKVRETDDPAEIFATENGGQFMPPVGVPTIPDTIRGWVESAGDERSAPYWVYASKVYKNPHVIPEVLSGMKNPKAQRELAVMHDRVATVQDTIREIDPSYDATTDTILLYRGVGFEIADELLDAKKNGNSIAAEHRAVESWSASPKQAGTFGTAVIKARIPVTSVLDTAYTNSFYRDDLEYVVATPHATAVYKPENILAMESDDFDEVWDKEITDYLEKWQKKLEFVR